MNNSLSPLAGKPAPKTMLVDLGRLEREYYDRQPDFADPSQRVSFGTSGHRGSSLRGTFTEAHILAITQAICEFRRMKGTDGPLYPDTIVAEARQIVDNTLGSSSAGVSAAKGNR